jgi:excisionase family DNA binding protein
MEATTTTAALWSAQQAAEYLGVRPSWVYEAARERRIPFYRLGKHLRFIRSDLDAWLREQRVDARPRPLHERAA